MRFYVFKTERRQPHLPRQLLKVNSIGHGGRTTRRPSDPTEEETIDWGGDDNNDEVEEDTPQEVASIEVAQPWDERYGRGRPANTFWENPSWQARPGATLTPRTEPYAWASYDEWVSR